MPQNDPTPEAEDRFHSYTGTAIPWYVHLLWVLFWVFTISYVANYLIPVLKTEMVAPP